MEAWELKENSPCAYYVEYEEAEVLKEHYCENCSMPISFRKCDNCGNKLDLW